MGVDKKQVMTLYEVFRKELSDRRILKRAPEESETESPVGV